MTLLKVFTPHLFVIAATVILCAIVVGIVRPAKPLVVAAALPVSLLIAIAILGLVPDAWIRATPTGNQAADAAIILGFGYQEDGGNLTDQFDWADYNFRSTNSRAPSLPAPCPESLAACAL